MKPAASMPRFQAVTVTNFHWGFHGWGLYVLVGLCLAYFSYRRDLAADLSARRSTRC